MSDTERRSLRRMERLLERCHLTEEDPLTVISGGSEYTFGSGWMLAASTDTAEFAFAVMGYLIDGDFHDDPTWYVIPWSRITAFVQDQTPAHRRYELQVAALAAASGDT